MKKFISYPGNIIILSLLVGVFTFYQGASAMYSHFSKTENLQKDRAIRLALLLDTSNSMDGLIEQAKSQLWNIVKELSQTQYDKDKTPELYIALYEYGNDGLSVTNGYVRLVAPFTQDMDLISEKLFALRTNGGSEYCGTVIDHSLKKLDWGAAENDLRMIYIAGNEAFTQGSVDFRGVCKKALDRDIVVNTIFCGDYEEGIRISWKTGADLAEGSYMNIDKDRKTVYIPTPYDDRIEKLNLKLNDTYIPYGAKGEKYQMNQKMQDSNAAKYSQANAVDRAVFKSSKMYKAKSWDLVEAFEADEKVIKKKDNLPEKLKGKSETEIRTYIEIQLKSREDIRKEINTTQKQREAFIQEKRSEQTEEKDLQNSMLKAIRKQAGEKGFYKK